MLRDLKLDGGRSRASDPDPPLTTVLGVLASLLRETTSRFERSSDRIAQLAVAREAGAAVELIVAMQDFDRLRQDFDCIAGVLRGCARVNEGQPEGQAPSLGQVISEIPVADFRNRLVQCLRWASHGSTAGDEPGEEAIF